jgi:hypothetical protein
VRLSVVDMQWTCALTVTSQVTALMLAQEQIGKWATPAVDTHRPAHSGFQGSGEMGPTLEDKELSTLFEPTEVCIS